MICQTLGRAKLSLPEGAISRHTAGHEADWRSQTDRNPCGNPDSAKAARSKDEDHAAFEGIRTPVAGLEPAEQHQDQHDDQHEADATAAVIAGAIERAATNAAKAAEQDDNQDDEQDCSERHGVSP